MSLEKSVGGPPLRPGDVVEVRPVTEILATLDKDGTLDGMPFMPEMIAHIGRRYTVTRRVDKICNTVDKSGSRRMRNTVYLADLRCDGSAHGGCQAGCKIYWKEAWLRRVDGHSTAPSTGNADAAALEAVSKTATRTVREVGGNRSDIWRCQATDALKASEPLKQRDLRQYWRELTNGNFGPLRFAGLAIRGFVMECAFLLGLLKPLPLRGPHQPRIVQLRAVRSTCSRANSSRCGRRKRLRPRLIECGMNRGLSFDREMLPFCGRTFRVKESVRRIIDDKTGRMLTIPKDCIILDGVVCSGERSCAGRWFCPREIYPFWRESWLKRVEGSEGS